MSKLKSKEIKRSQTYKDYFRKDIIVKTKKKKGRKSQSVTECRRI